MNKQGGKIAKQQQKKVAKKQPKKAVNKVAKRSMAARVTKKVYAQQATDKLLESAKAQKTDLYAAAEFFQKFKQAQLVIPQLSQVITHPLTTEARKREIINDIFSHMGADKPTVEFFSQLAVDNRLGLAKDALTKYRKMAADSNKDALATVTSALPLTTQQIASITKSLEPVAPKGQKVRVFQQVDPNILGGLIIQMDTFYQDLSMSAAYQVIEGKVQDATAV